MLKKEIILKSSPQVKLFAANARQKKLLAVITTPQGISYGYSSPFLMYAKIHAVGGAEIPPDSTLHIYKKRSGEDGEYFFGKISYAGYYGLTLGQQKDVAYYPQVRHAMAMPQGLENPEGHEFIIYIDTDVDVDVTLAGPTFIHIEPQYTN